MIATGLRRLLEWVRAPGWHQAWDDAVSRRRPNTCNWFYDTTPYLQWQSRDQVITQDGPALLLVQGVS